ncbi:ABC transporter permease [Bacillus toyonensis]|uniref:glycosyltransferase family 39 protein n=1 Tax=Bacillus toyonensis TaxID=155322 RepID=UPI000BF04B9B|nr:glycosyltransferase family 39 protein [Bacillus toyonensis]PEK51348.1 ABC transporter permease [Bacillus toyonensis]PEM42904.1 ABC transporter permease [Bacillus toyonensis]PHE89635.1 ABC transporter permease [Bacillus toyonensis]
MQKTLRSIPSLGVNLASCIILLIMCWSIFQQQDLAFSPFIIFGICTFIIFIYALVFLTRNISTKKYVYTISIVYLLISIIIIKLVPSSPISDFQYMLDGAKELAAGNMKAIKDNQYFFWNTTQLGFTIYEALVLTLTSHSYFALQFLNIVYTLLTGLAIFYIAKHRLNNETFGRFGFILYVTSINLFLLVPVLTNQHLSMMLFSWGTYHLLARDENKNYINMVLGGLLFALGNIIYPIGILFLIAAGLFLLFFHSNILKRNFISSITFISTYLVILYTLAYIPVILNISHNPITNADSGWKFVIGLNKESNGQYSLEDFAKLRQSIVDFDIEEHNRIQKQLIKERTENLTDLIPLMNKKNIIMWGSPTDSYAYIPINDIARNTINDISFIKLDFIHYVSIMLLSMGSVFIFLFSSPFKNLNMKYFQILIIGAFLIYLVTEVQIRYRYFFFPIFIILAAFTLQYIMNLSLFKMNKAQAGSTASTDS